jgi:hypothetical protein
VAIAAAGTGYGIASGTIAVTTAYGGVFAVTVNSSGVPTGVSQISPATYPSTTTPANPVATTTQVAQYAGTGLTLNLTWNTSATTLALQPTAGATTVGGSLSVTGTITPSSTNGIVGTTTNDNANAGSVGEVISASVASGSAVALTTGTTANVTSISLTAGDWDVEGTGAFFPAASTSITALHGSVGTTSATIGGATSGGRFSHYCAPVTPGATTLCFPTGRQRLSLSGTTTVYLCVQATFSTSTLGGFGYIVGRRIR